YQTAILVFSDLIIRPRYPAKRSPRPDRLNQFALVAQIYFGSEIVDVNIDNIGGPVKVARPDISDNLRARQDAIFPPHHVLEQAELARRQPQLTLASFHNSRPGIEREVIRSQNARWLFARAPQQRANASNQFPQVKGFGQVVVGAAVEPRNLALDRISGGE